MIITKRDFIKSLFCAPALVSINNIMPVKALEKFTHIPSYDQWLLVSDNGVKSWMKESLAKEYFRPLEIIKKVDVDMAMILKNSKDNLVATKLMKEYNALVIHELPSCMKNDLIIGY